jgi:hypothetical protein
MGQLDQGKSLGVIKPNEPDRQVIPSALCRNESLLYPEMMPAVENILEGSGPPGFAETRTHFSKLVESSHWSGRNESPLASGDPGVRFFRPKITLQWIVVAVALVGLNLGAAIATSRMRLVGRSRRLTSGWKPDLQLELAAADQYEQLAAYKRIAAMLASGKQAWVYVDARTASGASWAATRASFERMRIGRFDWRTLSVALSLTPALSRREREPVKR